MRGTPLSDLALVCLLVLLCTWSTPVSGQVRRSRNDSGTLSSTVLLQQVAWEGWLRSVRGCVALPWVELPLVAGAQVGPMARPVR